ncbi:transposase [Bacillus cereus]|uniref:transposase n=1 Tax=Bacillus cereus TaxID=1396 RepID=UPI0035A8ECEA
MTRFSSTHFPYSLASFKKLCNRTRPGTVDLYEVFCGVLYVLTTGCQWSNLPSDFPN